MTDMAGMMRVGSELGTKKGGIAVALPPISRQKTMVIRVIS
jgi:hypothetical protein